LGLQVVAQRLQLRDELFDFQHRAPGHALDQRVEVANSPISPGLRLAFAQLRDVPAHELADLALDFGRRSGPVFMSSPDHGHDASPLRREQSTTRPLPELGWMNRAPWRRFLVSAKQNTGRCVTLVAPTAFSHRLTSRGEGE